MSWFKRKPQPPPQTRITVIHSTAMTAAQFRSSPDLVKYAKTLFQSPEFQTLYAVLRNESPHNYGLPMGASHDDHIAHSYKGEGYTLCLNNIEALTRLVSATEPLEATWEPEPPRQMPDDQQLPAQP